MGKKTKNITNLYDAMLAIIGIRYEELAELVLEEASTEKTKKFFMDKVLELLRCIKGNEIMKGNGIIEEYRLRAELREIDRIVTQLPPENIIEKLGFEERKKKITEKLEQINKEGIK